MSHQSLLLTYLVHFNLETALVKIGDRRSPYRKLMKWLKENGRQPKPDDAKFIMSHNLNLAELTKLLAVNIPDQFLQELEHDLDEELRSIRLYEDTLSTLEELKKSLNLAVLEQVEACLVLKCQVVLDQVQESLRLMEIHIL